MLALGASAGGIEALKKFLTRMPSDAGAALVVILHLDPHHESLLAEVLSRYTAMPVHQVQKRQTLQPNQVYVTPPNKYLTLKNGVIGSSRPRKTRSGPPLIDTFLRELAQDCGTFAACGILSGTGSDGSLGLRTIKEYGGLVMVQSPENSAYDGMPRSAIATGLVDYILDADAMPDAYIGYISKGLHQPFPDTETESERSEKEIQQLLSIFRIRMKVDLSYYKGSTLLRRTLRRAGIVHAESLASYVTQLRTDPAELENLYKDLLIGVTQFFRDPRTYAVLNDKVLPGLIDSGNAEQTLRIWVPGCSTGEEAYSIAMVVLEFLTHHKLGTKLQIFATDIDEEALETARAGFYGSAIEVDVSPERLRRFFDKEGSSYRIVKQVRECIAFAKQNVISDPPFSKMDVVSCRNLLIYIESAYQDKVLGILHYALREGGFLFLGPSETIGNNRSLFNTLERGARIFRRLPTPSKLQVDFPILPTIRGDRKSPRNAMPNTQGMHFAELTHRQLALDHGPPSVLIDHHLRPLHFFGSLDRFLRIPKGEPGQDLLAMTREGLRGKLRGLISRVMRNQTSATQSGITLRGEGKRIPVTIKVSPVQGEPAGQETLLVSFLEEKPLDSETDSQATAAIDNESDIDLLEGELRTTKEELQSTIEELETTNEEMKASHEEALSMNEELQSANEELETSKEELQSLNEELNTVNSEINEKVEALEESRNLIDNLLNSTDIATLFLDTHLRIRRFTSAMTRLIEVIETDVGRPIDNFSWKFTDPDLLRDAEAVLNGIPQKEREIRGGDETWFLRRIVPFRTGGGRSDGIVITFTDVTALKRGEEGLRRLATVVMDSNDAISVLDSQDRISAWNKAAAKLYGYSEAEALGMNYLELVPEEDRAATQEFLESARKGNFVESYQARRITRERMLRTAWVTITVMGDRGEPTAVLSITERDITDQIKVEERLRHAQKLEGVQQLAAGVAHEFNNLLQVVIGFNQIAIRDLPKTNPAQKSLERIKTAAERGAALVTELLGFSQNKTFNPTLVNVNQLISSLAPLLQPTLGENIVLNVEADPTLPIIWVDEGSLEQIIINLSINARDAMKQGGSLTISTRKAHFTQPALESHPRAAPGDYVQIAMADTGEGIEENVIRHIFEPFFTTKGPQEGSGLGLSMVYGLVEQQAGWIDVSSRPGVGTRFDIFLPVHAVMPSGRKKAAPPRRAGREEGTILVAEDEPGIQDLAQTILEDEGYTVLIATNGEEAIAMFDREREHIDLVLLDFAMPKLGGVEVYTHIQALEPGLPVLFLTGHAIEHLPDEVPQGSERTLLHKPIEPNVLIELVRSELARMD